MKKNHISLITILIFITALGHSETKNPNIITSDIDHFWQAYDMVISTDDPDKQMQYFNELYLDKGTTGLNAIMEARSYTP